jgi:hypothetical protein
MDFDLLLGFPLEKLLAASLGSLDEKLKEAASATTTSCLGHPTLKPLPNQNPLEKTTYVSPFASSKHDLIKVAGFSRVGLGFRV